MILSEFGRIQMRNLLFWACFNRDKYKKALNIKKS